MEKVDFKKIMKAFWQPPVGVFSLVDVPKLQFAMIDGKGDPNTSEEYRHAIEWLYSVSYPLKFMSKKELGKDYGVAPLEGLWWAEDMSSFLTGDKHLWSWTMMIMQPDWITGEMFKAVLDKACAKLGEPPESLRLQFFHEGTAVQIMHIGPYSAEGPTILRLHEEFLPANGLVENGKHHEIYLGDPRKAAPEKLRTVIRQPVRKR
ncbi:GyrI-like domain-containing protein [Mesorhizobium qingshengii]|uniref:GyrI-like domain-containing protein n=1 Tax=Mesorhizobium qingshengii TaxID=1165689 RepID=A0ABT4R3K8_9HYPH|nr:GyrI-like domain-containing protein [Mesorhizobium qingshengii]MCZ8548417.1 GyrI-like domain-containing protein [Mesorhizobium qingshengii]